MDRLKRLVGRGAGGYAGDGVALNGGGLHSSSSGSGAPRATNLTSLNSRPQRGGGGARPSLMDRRRPFSTGVQRFGVAKMTVYLGDPFHTLLSLPWWKFILIFFTAYITQFCTFAFIYLSFTPDVCTIGVNHKFSHALWMSSRVASTLGFGAQIYPNADCVGVNLIVMLQVICSSLIDFIMLGIVFARFSAPVKRAGSIRFSHTATLSRHVSGHWALSLRVANIRKHQLLKPEFQLLLIAIDSITPSNYVFQYLEIEKLHVQQTNLQLGLPGNLVHVITPSSPLYALSLEEMDTRMMEVLVFVDGVDAMTSKQLQARKAYTPSDMHIATQFLDMHLEMRGGKLGLDFKQFDTMVAATDDLLGEYAAAPHLASMPLVDMQHHLHHLRHQTFKRLTEHGKPRAGAAAAAAAASAGGGAPAGPSGGGSAAVGPPVGGGGGAGLPHGLPPSSSVVGAGAAGGVVSVEMGAVPGLRRPDDARNPFDQRAAGFSTLPL